MIYSQNSKIQKSRTSSVLVCDIVVARSRKVDEQISETLDRLESTQNLSVGGDMLCISHDENGFKDTDYSKSIGPVCP